MPDTPHFALPFRLEGGSFAVNEQDSAEDVAACVEAVIRTRPGERDELPAFGVTDPAFQQAPIDTDLLVEQVNEWEPRAKALAEETPDLFDATVRRVRLEVGSDTSG